MNGKKGKDSKKQTKNPEKAVKAFVLDSTLKSDPLGSYTGKPVNKNEKPVQDADDL